jgi:hypothetical protein
MSTRMREYQSDFVRRFVLKGRAEGMAWGMAEGMARAVLAVLEARGIAVPDDARARITECSDLDQLETWVRRAVTAASMRDLFD